MSEILFKKGKGSEDEVRIVDNQDDKSGEEDWADKLLQVVLIRSYEGLEGVVYGDFMGESVKGINEPFYTSEDRNELGSYFESGCPNDFADTDEELPGEVWYDEDKAMWAVPEECEDEIIWDVRSYGDIEGVKQGLERINSEEDYTCNSLTSFALRSDRCQVQEQTGNLAESTQSSQEIIVAESSDN